MKIKKVIYFLATFCTMMCAHNVPFKLGIENIDPSYFTTIFAKNDGVVRVGLVTNQTGVTQKGERTVDVLIKNGCAVGYIFVPEHGLQGKVLAAHDVSDCIDEKTNIPVISLYGNGTGKMISPEQIDKIDCIVFDMQDCGMRHYTYISTLLQTMKLAAHNKKKFIVLDRPNPLGGLMQGPLVEPDLLSFISVASIPLRHGMTIGELARYFNEHVLTEKVGLHVVTMSGYDRSLYCMDALLAPLSPNIQTIESCYGYSFLGLLGEVSPFDVGVGTPLAFRCILLPESLQLSALLWKKLQKKLSSHGIRSSLYGHVNIKTKKRNVGLLLDSISIEQTQSFNLFLDIVTFFKNDVTFSFGPSFDKAVGSKKVKEVFAGSLSQQDFLYEVQRDLVHFRKQAQKSFLYVPYPSIRIS